MSGEGVEGQARATTLESWKAIARHLQRDVRTVQRWEQEEGLPIHRHQHGKQVTVYAHPHEIDEWRAGRDVSPPPKSALSARRLTWLIVFVTVAGLVALIVLESRTENPNSQSTSEPRNGETGPVATSVPTRQDFAQAWNTLDQYNPVRLTEAEELFHALHEADPDNAEPLTGLALIQVGKGFFHIVPAREAYRQAEQYAQQALHLDANQGVAKSVLGWVEFVYRWDWSGAERLFLEAVKSSPDSMWTHWMLANYYGALNRPDEAIAEMTQALRLNPDSPHALVGLGYTLNNARRSQAAIEHLTQVGERLGLLRVGEFLRQAYEYSGDYERAVAMAKQLGHPYAERQEAALRERGAEGYWSVIADHFSARLERFPDAFAYRHAIAAANSGDTKKAISMLELGYHKREGTMVWLPIYPLEPLYDEPAFRSLVENMGLQEAFAGKLD